MSLGEPFLVYSTSLSVFDPRKIRSVDVDCMNAKLDADHNNHTDNSAVATAYQALLGVHDFL